MRDFRRALYFPTSFYSRRVLFYLKERGDIPVKFSIVNVLEYDYIKPNYILRVNEAGKIPTIEYETGKYMADSPKIIDYLDKHYEGNQLKVDNEVANNLLTKINALDMITITYGTLMDEELSKSVQFPTAIMDKMKGNITDNFAENEIKAQIKLIPSLSEFNDDEKEKLRLLYEKKLSFHRTEKAHSTSSADITAAFASLTEILKIANDTYEQNQGDFIFGDKISTTDLDIVLILERITKLGLGSKFCDEEFKGVRALYKSVMERQSAKDTFVYNF